MLSVLKILSKASVTHRRRQERYLSIGHELAHSVFSACVGGALAHDDERPRRARQQVGGARHQRRVRVRQGHWFGAVEVHRYFVFVGLSLQQNSYFL